MRFVRAWAERGRDDFFTFPIGFAVQLQTLFRVFLKSFANRVPDLCITQQEGWEILKTSRAARRLRSTSLALAERVLLGPSGIDQRCFALAPGDALFNLDPSGLNKAFEHEAPRLAGAALELAMQSGRVLPEHIDGLVVCTCTGYLCPGLSSHVAERLGLPNSVAMLDLAGQGCGALIPALRAANGLLASGCNRIAVVAVEVCSAAYYLSDDPDVIISACLFGDGASASIWTRRPESENCFRASAFQSIHIPEEREALRFTSSRGYLRNHLSRRVPALAADAVSTLYKCRQENENLTIVAHPGGREVIAALQSKLPNLHFEAAKLVLSRFGNMSSPSVFFVLEECLKDRLQLEPLWLTAFGAGFSCHSVKLDPVVKNDTT